MNLRGCLVGQQSAQSFLAFGQRQRCNVLALQIEEIENKQDQLVGSALIHGGLKTTEGRHAIRPDREQLARYGLSVDDSAAWLV